jgi:3-oxoacyl-[acyl-carrier-protein] synthase-3
MTSSLIVGTGTCLPDNVVTNNDLARIMDTTDEWIVTRTGVSERRFADPGVGSSDLATRAADRALTDAGIGADDVDLLITATMTPDYIAPGIAGLVQAGLGLRQVTAIDLRQQCAGFLYGMDLADAYVSSGRAETVVLVGSEVHAGFLPWSADSWEVVLGGREQISAEERSRNSEFRSWSVLFGDGAGAMVLRRNTADTTGILASSLSTDGEAFELIWVPGIGFKDRPYATREAIANDRHLPIMDGPGLYRRAVRAMPEAVRTVMAEARRDIEELDLLVAHQANDRILEGVRRQLGMSEEKVPSNIASYGNTTAATLPILYHDLRAQGVVSSGKLVCFTAFGAGAHYGAILYEEA